MESLDNKKVNRKDAKSQRKRKGSVKIILATLADPLAVLAVKEKKFNAKTQGAKHTKNSGKNFPCDPCGLEVKQGYRFFHLNVFK